MRKQKPRAVTAMSSQAGPAWIEILGVTEFSKLSTVKQSYQHLLQRNHDDTKTLAELKEAWGQAQKALS